MERISIALQEERSPLLKHYYSLSDTEKKIMELLWQLEEPLSLRETMDYLNEKLNKDWKQQTIGTYLSHLEKAGLVRIDKRFARSYLYFPACTKEEYTQKYLQKLVSESFNNSIADLVCAFTGGKKLSKKDLKELQKLI